MCEDNVENMRLEEALAIIESSVYQSCQLFEKLESAGKISSIGHYMRREIAASAGKLLSECWNN